MALIDTHYPARTFSLTTLALRFLRLIRRRNSPEEMLAAETRRAEARRAVDRLL